MTRARHAVPGIRNTIPMNAPMVITQKTMENATEKASKKILASMNEANADMTSNAAMHAIHSMDTSSKMRRRFNIMVNV